jgi:hypothetical protein
MAKRKKFPQRRVRVTWYGDDILDIVHKHGDEALFEMGKVVMGAADRRVPVGRTGNLRKSGYISTASKSTYAKRHGWRKEKKPPTNGATVGFSAPHAHLIESGRRKSGKFGPRKSRGKQALKIGDRFVARSRFKRMHSRPFLGPAIEETNTTMVEALAKSLRGKLENALRATIGL